MWNLNDLNAPESEALQAEREIVETIVASHVPDDACDRCGRRGELYHNEASGLALCEPCDLAPEPDIPVRFKRLRDRSWGLSGPARLLQPDAVVTVSKRDGSHSTVTVGQVVWQEDGKAFATIRRG